MPDLGVLADDLEKLRRAMHEESSGPAHDIATGAVAAADGDEEKLLRALRSAGKWAFETATKIALPVATEAVKRPLGLG